MLNPLGVTDGCESLLCGMGEPNSVPLQEQQVLLTAELKLYSFLTLELFCVRSQSSGARHVTQW